MRRTLRKRYETKTLIGIAIAMFMVSNHAFGAKNLECGAKGPSGFTNVIADKHKNVSFDIPRCYPLERFWNGFRIGLTYPDFAPSSTLSGVAEGRMNILVLAKGPGPSVAELEAQEAARPSGGIRAFPATAQSPEEMIQPSSHKLPTRYLWRDSSGNRVTLVDWGLPGVDLYHQVADQYEIHSTFSRDLLGSRRVVDESITKFVADFEHPR
jgi:hypothetical protein